MVTEHQREQQERREYIEDERRKRQQGSTFHQHAIADAEFDRGRFTANEKVTVIGSSETPQYPQLPSGPWSGQDPVPDEPPLGFSVNDMPIEPSTVSASSPVEVGPTSEADAPSTVVPFSDVQLADGVGPSSSTGGGDEAA
jgi:hypothetical protein